MAAPMAAVGIGASVLGGIVGASGAQMQGQAQANMYNYQAGIAQMNERIAKQNASYASFAGEVQSEISGMKTRQEVGSTVATQGASGLRVGTGSADRVVQSEEEVGQYDQSMIRSNAAKAAYGYEVEAVQQEAQSNIDIMAAQNAKTAGDYGAASSILGAASSVSSQWIKASSAGVFG